MDFSPTTNLQLNREQATLSEEQQNLLLAIIGRLLSANYDPHRGSLLIVRTWADGTFEKVLSGDLALGTANSCHTQKFKMCPGQGLKVVNDACYESNVLVGLEVAAAIKSGTPGTFYYDKINPNAGSIYAENGRYILSLPLENGRIIASYRASYCWRSNRISVSINEPWQHRLMLASLAEAFCKIMPQDQRLVDSLAEIELFCKRHNCANYSTNSAIIARCIARKDAKVSKVINMENSKMPATRWRVAYA